MKIIVFPLMEIYQTAGFLEAVGGVSLILLIVYLIIKHHDNEITRGKEDSQLLEYSEKYKKYTKKFGDYGDLQRMQNNPEFRNKYNKEVEKILNDPEERARAIKKKQEEEENHHRIQAQIIKDNKENRKFGYKYDTDIFEIFDTDDELTKSKILSRIQLHYNIDEIQSENLLELWENHSLVNEVIFSKEWIIDKKIKDEIEKNNIPNSFVDTYYDMLWKKYFVSAEFDEPEKKYEVGDILKYDFCKLTESDLTWKEWLELKGKKKRETI